MSQESDADRRFMRQALALAEAGWGRVHPNPMVGAVVVRDDAVIGTGAHREFGGPHAEVEALAAAGAAARGATLYVTMEPCAHHGKTPPCTDAILAAGVSRVVLAAEDPNPVARGGAQRLRDAGVEVVTGVERRRARRQNAMFFHALERGSTWLALKYALSLDGRLSRVPGRPTRVTGPEAQRDVHRLRAGFDAIMVGIGTALADDPRLTVRGEITPRRPPARVVLDAALRLPPGSALADTSAAPTWVFAAHDAPSAGVLERRGVRVFRVGRNGTGIERGGTELDLEEVLARLRAEGVESVLCEGGGTLGAALLRADRASRLWLYVAPLLLGDQGTAAFPGAFPPGPADGWAMASPVRLGGDVRLQLDRIREDG